MQRRDFIIGTLVRAGFRTSLKGFDQFCTCVEMYSDNRTTTIECIYAEVARRFDCSASAVEKNLRRLFSSSDACAAMGRLFDMKVDFAGNKEIVAMFANYVALNRHYYTDAAC